MQNYKKNKQTQRKNVVLLGCKCSPFAIQKDYICKVKGVLLKRKRTPFGKRRDNGCYTLLYI